MLEGVRQLPPQAGLGDDDRAERQEEGNAAAQIVPVPRVSPCVRTTTVVALATLAAGCSLYAAVKTYFGISRGERFGVELAQYQLMVGAFAASLQERTPNRQTLCRVILGLAVAALGALVQDQLLYGVHEKWSIAASDLTGLALCMVGMAVVAKCGRIEEVED